MSRWLPPWGIRPADREPEPPSVPAAEAVKAVDKLLRERDKERGLRRGFQVELSVARLDLAEANERIKTLSALVNVPVSEEAKRWQRQAEQDRQNCHDMQKQLDQAREELRHLTLEHGWVTGRNMAQDFDSGQRTGVG